MAIPIVYNIRSVRARWTSTIVAVLGIAGTVGVFIAMLSLARGFQATLVASGSPDNALIVRAGATSEMTSGVPLDSVKIIQDAPGIARGANGPMVTPEAVLMAPIPLLSTGTEANVELRGVSPNVLEIRKQVKIVQGRMFKAGLAEVVVGKNATNTYSGLTLGQTIALGTVRWQVVGIFDAGGSSFDSEVWGDSHLLSAAYSRPDNSFQSVTVHLTSPEALGQLKDSVTTDPRLNVDVIREIDYYAKQSTSLTTLITRLGGFVAMIMAIGAVFGALNTMYSAVADRGREIATMRPPGFPVHGHVHTRHLSKRREQVTQLAFRGLKTHVPDKQTLHLDSPRTLRSTMSAGSRQARASRTLLYTGLKLPEFNGGRSKRTPPQGVQATLLRESTGRQ